MQACSRQGCCVPQLWRHALGWTAENMLAGFAGVKGRCTNMGRAAMSLDLQQVGHLAWQRAHPARVH